MSAEVAYEQQVVRQRIYFAQHNDLVQTYTFGASDGQLAEWDGQTSDLDLQRTVQQSFLEGNCDPDRVIDQMIGELGINNHRQLLDDMQVEAETQTLLDELKSLFQVWASVDEDCKFNFFREVPKFVKQLGVPLAAEVLLPKLDNLIDHHS